MLGFICVMFFFTSFSQAPTIAWEKSLGGYRPDYAQSIKQTSDGGYIVAGYSASFNGMVTGNHGAEDYWIVKLDNTGNIIRQKSYGGSQTDYAYSVIQTSDGGYMVAGETFSNDGDFSEYKGYGGCWIIKLDGDGNLVWQKTLGGTGLDIAYSLFKTKDNKCLIAGYSSSKESDLFQYKGGGDGWIVKLDEYGNILWSKNYGGSDIDVAYSITETTDSSYIFTGTTASRDSGLNAIGGYYDYWVVKVDNMGSLIWQKTYGGASEEKARSVVSAPDGGYVVAGYTFSKDGDVSGIHGNFWQDYWILRINKDGNIIWKKIFGGTREDDASEIQKTADGGYIVVGSAISIDGDVVRNHGISDYWVIKLDSSGNSIWLQPYGGSNFDIATSIQPTSDNGYIMAGRTLSHDKDVSYNNGDCDYWIVKLNSDAVLPVTLQNFLAAYQNKTVQLSW